MLFIFFFFFQAEDGIRDLTVTGVQTCALPILYQDAIARAFELGVNMIDTAINYRHQRSERAIRTALAAAVRRGAIRRDEIADATKGGYIPFAGAAPRDSRASVTVTYINTGIVSPCAGDGGPSCVTARYAAY